MNTTSATTKPITSISISKETKTTLDKKLETANENRKSKSKLCPANLITYLLNSMTSKQLDYFTDLKLTWEEEEPILKRKYEAEHEKVLSIFEWEQLKHKGQLLKYFQKNSIVWQRDLQRA